MKEELLHYIWKTRSFPFVNLETTQQEVLQIDHFGYYNLNSGPDFLEGGISLGETQWRGHIEIHINSSDWIKHGHQVDPAYDNVILHVVWEEDEIIYRLDGSRIPCLEMKKLISKSILLSYDIFVNRNEKISCGQELRHGNKDLFYLQLNKMAIERLEEKCFPIALELEENKQDWFQLLFFMLSKSFGLKVNSDAMIALARSIPLKLISKHRDQLFQLEALLYGQAGMLMGKWKDNYPKSLYREYQFLKKKYNLVAISGLEWRLMRMRPTSFPTIRISQLAALYYNHQDLHAKIVNATSIEEIKFLFQVDASDYWDSHHLFDKKTKERKKRKIGSATIDSIIINGILPFLFAYGQYRSDDEMIERVLDMMEAIIPENNRIIREWRQYSIKPKNAFESQALIQLKKNYCSKKRCLECSFGSKVLATISNKIEEESRLYI